MFVNCMPSVQVLGASLEAHVYASDNSALARDCRRDIKNTNAKLLKLGRKVMVFPSSPARLNPSIPTLASLPCTDFLLPGFHAQAHGDRDRLGVQDYAERRALRGELRALQREERQRQQRAVAEVLQRAAVVCATLSGTLMRELHPLCFDLAVIDEAAQVLTRCCFMSPSPTSR